MFRRRFSSADEAIAWLTAPTRRDRTLGLLTRLLAAWCVPRHAVTAGWCRPLTRSWRTRN